MSISERSEQQKFVREAKLRRFANVQRRDSGYTGRRMLKIKLPGMRK